ncbi:MAG: hypothetical protein ACUVTG_16060 [Candidatus Oleimicrobiaceae bacterium]
MNPGQFTAKEAWDLDYWITHGQLGVNRNNPEIIRATFDLWQEDGTWKQ